MSCILKSEQILVIHTTTFIKTICEHHNLSTTYFTLQVLIHVLTYCRDTARLRIRGGRNFFCTENKINKGLIGVLEGNLINVSK